MHFIAEDTKTRYNNYFMIDDKNKTLSIYNPVKHWTWQYTPIKVIVKNIVSQTITWIFYSLHTKPLIRIWAQWLHDDVIKWKHFPRYWPFVRGIHRSMMNSPHKGQWREALMFSLICAWINDWVNNREAGDLRCHHAHYDIIVMTFWLVNPFE